MSVLLFITFPRCFYVTCVCQKWGSPEKVYSRALCVTEYEWVCENNSFWSTLLHAFVFYFHFFTISLLFSVFTYFFLDRTVFCLISAHLLFVFLRSFLHFKCLFFGLFFFIAYVPLSWAFDVQTCVKICCFATNSLLLCFSTFAIVCSSVCWEIFRLRIRRVGKCLHFNRGVFKIISNFTF